MQASHSVPFLSRWLRRAAIASSLALIACDLETVDDDVEPTDELAETEQATRLPNFPIFGIHFWGPGAETLHANKGMWSVEMLYTARWSTWDDAKKNETRAKLQNIVNRGGRVILRIDYEWNQVVAPNWDFEKRKAMALAAYDMADRMGDLISVYVIGNELRTDLGGGTPQTGPLNPVTPDWYTYVFNRYDENCVYKKIKAALAKHGWTGRVAIAAPTGWVTNEDRAFFEHALAHVDKDALGKPQIDAFALHAYSGSSTWSDLNAEDPRFADGGNFKSFAHYAQRIYETYGPGRPIYITETNTYAKYGDAWDPNLKPKHSEETYRADWMKEAYQAIDEWNRSNDQKIDALAWYVYQHDVECGTACDQWNNSLVRTDDGATKLVRARQDLAWVMSNTTLVPGRPGSTLRFQAENYTNNDVNRGNGDRNGRSLASCNGDPNCVADFHDTTANNTGTKYRQEDVDIGLLPDWSGFFVGWTQAGEWLRYETLAGGRTYRLRMKFARLGTGNSKVRILVDGVQRGGDVYLWNTGSWDTYAIFDGTTNFDLPRGKHEIKLVFDHGNVNVDWFELVPVAVP